MKRALVVLLFALGVSACGAPVQGGSAAPSGNAVQLLTGGDWSCWAGGGPTVEGPLLSDPKYGTAIKSELSHGQPSDGRTMPVMWPTDFSLRLVGSEVAVLDPVGKVVATTGKRYLLEAGPVNDPESSRVLKDIGAFAACGNAVPK